MAAGWQRYADVVTDGGSNADAECVIYDIRNHNAWVQGTYWVAVADWE